MFFIAPLITLYSGHIILIVAAVIPAIFLLRFIYRSDRLEPEPKDLIWDLVKKGIISTFVAVMCERLGQLILNLFFAEETTLYNILMYFIVVGLSEEASKYVLLEKRTWDSPHFNCKFDGVVYAVTVSLGFALWENIEYVLNYGFETALIRAVTAVPGHACFGVFMGVWYGLAKSLSLKKDESASKTCRRLAVIIPAFIHGCYDYIATMTDPNSTIIFVVFVAVMFIASYLVVKRLSETDRYLDSEPATARKVVDINDPRVSYHAVDVESGDGESGYDPKVSYRPQEDSNQDNRRD